MISTRIRLNPLKHELKHAVPWLLGVGKFVCGNVKLRIQVSPEQLKTADCLNRYSIPFLLAADWLSDSAMCAARGPS